MQNTGEKSMDYGRYEIRIQGDGKIIRDIVDGEPRRMERYGGIAFYAREKTSLCLSYLPVMVFLIWA
jgi:hypothetical protein